MTTGTGAHAKSGVSLTFLFVLETATSRVRGPIFRKLENESNGALLLLTVIVIAPEKMRKIAEDAAALGENPSASGPVSFVTDKQRRQKRRISSRILVFLSFLLLIFVGNPRNSVVGRFTHNSYQRLAKHMHTDGGWKTAHPDKHVTGEKETETENRFPNSESGGLLRPSSRSRLENCSRQRWTTTTALRGRILCAPSIGRHKT